jgi:hypothetical protein
MKDEIFNKSYLLEFDELINNSKIIYHDFINDKIINTVYEITDILLIPSAYETGSFTTIEAFYYGIPVIARNVFGLKYLIKNNITGLLCNDDEDIIEKIVNIKKYNNFDRKLIKKESLKYNITDKINDLENIINNFYIQKNNKNIIIITSVINITNTELSYYHKRSVFSINERYEQTLITIKSIKDKIPNIELLFCECSDLINYKNIEDNIKKSVDYYFNFYDDELIRNNVNSKFKGYGEASILINGIEKLLNLKNNYKNIFKLSGRYYLNDNFNFEDFNNNKNIFTNWDDLYISYNTIFYKINGSNIIFFKNALINSLEDLKNNNSIEMCIYKNFDININIINQVNVSGYLSTEGYLIEL